MAAACAYAAAQMRSKRSRSITPWRHASAASPSASARLSRRSCWARSPSVSSPRPALHAETVTVRWRMSRDRRESTMPIGNRAGQQARPRATERSPQRTAPPTPRPRRRATTACTSGGPPRGGALRLWNPADRPTARTRRCRNGSQISTGIPTAEGALPSMPFEPEGTGGREMTDMPPTLLRPRAGSTRADGTHTAAVAIHAG